MLEDSTTYLQLTSDPTQEFKNRLGKRVGAGNYMGVLSQKQAKFILIEHPSFPIFHSLTKLHKSNFPPALCPNESGIGSLNENL